MQGAIPDFLGLRKRLDGTNRPPSLIRSLPHGCLIGQRNSECLDLRHIVV